MNLAAQQPSTEPRDPSPGPTGANPSNIRSPKRKRTDSVRQTAFDVEFKPVLKAPPIPFDPSDDPCAPPLSTPPQQIVNEESRVDLGEGSPRTIVARSFENLTLRGSEKPVLHFGSVGQDVKKARLMEHIDLDSCDIGLEPTNSNRGDTNTETTPSTAPTTATPGENSAWQRPGHASAPQAVPRQPRKSPPPPVLSATALPAAPSPAEADVSAATWRDSEITGHLALDPDDDLTGMNGIGFRPTPQVAYARAQARRRQVAEWRNREAREARARRAETRRRGVAARADAVPPGKERVVRFAA